MIPLGTSTRHTGRFACDLVGTRSGVPIVAGTKRYHGCREVRIQGARQRLPEGHSFRDSYTLSTLQKATCKGGVWRLKWMNGGRTYDLTGFVPGLTTSSPAIVDFLVRVESVYTAQDPTVQICGAFPGWLVNAAVLQAHAKLDKTVVQSSVSAVESPSTIKMLRLVKLAKLLRSPSKTIVAGLTDLHRNVRKTIKKSKTLGIGDTATVAGNYWLEYRMGLMPAIQEFEQIRNLILNGVKSHVSGIHRVTSYCTLPPKGVSQQVSWSSGWTDGYYSGYIQGTILYRGEFTDRAGCTVFYRESALSDAEKYRVALGLTAGDIPGHVWETIPLSFVVDRFVDVGTWIKAWKPKPGITTLASVTTRKRGLHVQNADVTKVVCQALYVKEMKEPFDYKIERLSRSTSPTRSFVPLLNANALKFKQHLDHVALTLQRIPKDLVRRSR